MTLFDLDPGPEELLGDGSSALLYRGVFDPVEADRLFATLLAELSWDQPMIRMYGKVLPQPRLVAWVGDAEAAYSYSGDSYRPKPWTATLLALKAHCERLAEARFNSVLANLYRDGDDSVAWHADDEPELGAEPVIASLSLGAERRFHLRPRPARAPGEGSVGQRGPVRVDLPAGSVLVMSGRTQADWLHQVSKTKRAVGPRINLTFRNIVSPTEQSSGPASAVTRSRYGRIIT